MSQSGSHFPILRPGSRVGPLEVLEELGRGSTGAVFRVRHATLGRVGALKLVFQGAKDEQRRRRFEREVVAQARLDHPGIVKIHGTHEIAGALACEIELVAGETLEARIAQKGAYPWREGVRLVAKIARAIEHAHARGVVHRDLKPENVLLREDGSPVVADFGLSLLVDLKSSLTKTGAVVGTPVFAAPEALGGETGPPVDAYGLGALLSVAITGEAPFEGQTLIELFRKITAGECPPIEVAGAPRAIEAIRARCMAREPDARPTPGEVARELEELLETGESPRSSRAAIFASLALALAIAGASLLRVRTHSSPEARPGASPSASARVSPQPTSSSNVGARSFPDACRGFLATKHTRLATLFGCYGFQASGVVLARPLPGGADLVVSGFDGLTIVDARTFETRLTLVPRPEPGQPIPILEAQPSRDGRRLITWGKGGARVFELPSGNVLACLPVEDPDLVRVAFSPDAQKAFTMSRQGDLELWEIATPPELIRRIEVGGHGCSLLSDDGTRAFIGGSDGEAVLMDLATLEKVHRFKGHEGLIQAIALAPDARRALTGGADGTIRVWDVEAEKELLRIPTGAETPSRLAFLRAGTRALAGTLRGSLFLVDTTNGRELWRRFASNANSWIRSIAISAEEDRAYVVEVRDRHARLRLVDLARGDELRLPDRHAGPITAFSADPASGLVATGDRGGEVLIWEGGKPPRLLEQRQVPIVQLNFVKGSKDDPSLVVASSEGVDLVETKTGTRRVSLRDIAPESLASRASDDGQFLLTSEQSLLRRFRVSDGKEVDRVTLPEKAFGWNVLSADGARNVVGFRSGVFLEVDLPLGGLRTIGRLEGPISYLRLAANKGLALVRTDRDDRFFVVSIETGATLFTLETPSTKPDGIPQGTAFSPDRKLLAIAHGDGTIRLFELEHGTELDRIDLASSDEAPSLISFEDSGRTFLVATDSGNLLRFEVLPR